MFFVKLWLQAFSWRLWQFMVLHLCIHCRLELTLSSPGTQYAQQSYKVSDTFPFKWINKKWKEGFYVTAMATAGSRWAVVMSRNAGFTSQVCVTVPLVLSVHNLTVEWNWLVDLLKLIWKEFKILWICELRITKVKLLKHNTKHTNFFCR